MDHGRPHQRLENPARTGKDELNLADWRISVSTHQQPRKVDGGKIDLIEYEIDRAEGTRQVVTLMAPSRVGLPTPADEDVLIGLLAIAKQDAFASDTVTFHPTQLFEVLGWARTANSYDRLDEALTRLTALTVRYELSWFDRMVQDVQPILTTGIISECELVRTRSVQRKGRAEPRSYIQWRKTFYKSLQNGNLTDLNLDLYFSLRRPGSKHLFRHLNKRWHAGRKPRTYERDLRELACGHLGMTDTKDLKRNFEAVVAELEDSGYIQPLDRKERFRKVRKGVWRVKFDLHEAFDRTARRRSAASLIPEAESTEVSPAVALVQLYHRYRFGKDEYRPRPSEIKYADELLQDHSADELTAVMSRVAARVKEQFPRGKVFGACRSYIDDVIGEVRKDRRVREREQQQQVVDEEHSRKVRQQKAERAKRRGVLLGHWQSLSEQEQESFRQAAIDQHTGFHRSRLQRHTDLSKPLDEMLDEMATQEGLPTIVAPREDASAA